MTKISQSELREIQSNLARPKPKRRSRAEGIGEEVYFKIVSPERPRRWNLMQLVGLGLVGFGILLLVWGVR